MHPRRVKSAEKGIKLGNYNNRRDRRQSSTKRPIGLWPFSGLPAEPVPKGGQAEEGSE